MRFFIIITILALSISSCRSCTNSKEDFSIGVCIYDEYVCNVVNGQTKTQINSRLCKQLTEFECKNLGTDIDEHKFCTEDYDRSENSFVTNVSFFKQGQCPKASTKKVDSKTTGACFFKEEICHIVDERPQINVVPHACLFMTDEDCRSLENECEAQCVVDAQDVGSSLFCMSDYAKEGDIRKSSFSFFPNTECPKK